MIEPSDQLSGDSSEMLSPAVTADASPMRRRRYRSLLVVVVVVSALGGGWYFKGAPERAYFRALESGNLLQEFPNRDVALLQGEAFCESLLAGADATGFKRQKAAVDAFCPQFAAGFTIVPTPEEQQKSLLNQLRENGLGGLAASDAAAVASAKAVCARLDAGGESKGVKADAIAVDVYCSQYASGFRVLEEITVHGLFTIYNSNYYYPSIGKSGDRCYGANGYSDIDEGTRVVVKNQAGKILTETTLGTGTGSYSKCKFPFDFTVLEGETKYQVEVGRRGTVSYSESELKIPERVRLYLG